MKNTTKLLIAAIALLLNCSAFAQETPLQLPKDYPKPGGYGKNVNLQKFVGKWQWQSGDTVFVIALEKIMLKSKLVAFKGYTEDAIIGWHEFRVGEKVIESSLKFEGGSFDDRTHTISGGLVYEFNSHITENKLTVTSFRDLSKNKSGEATLELLPGEKDKARWVLKEKEGIIFLFPGETYDHTFTVPTNVVMERVRNKNK